MIHNLLCLISFHSYRNDMQYTVFHCSMYIIFYYTSNICVFVHPDDGRWPTKHVAIITKLYVQMLGFNKKEASFHWKGKNIQQYLAVLCSVMLC